MPEPETIQFVLEQMDAYLSSEVDPDLDRIEIWRKQLANAQEKAVEALRPFAELRDTVDNFGHEDDSTAPHRLKAGDIRRAAELVEAMTNA